MDWSVSPSLHTTSSAKYVEWGSCKAYLVVESPFHFEVLEVCLVRLTPPEVHISDFEVTPDCSVAMSTEMIGKEKRTQLTVAHVVGLASVIGNEVERVVVGYVLGVETGEFWGDHELG